MKSALDSGITLIDTADCYARGISERLVGRETRRAAEVVVCTKVGLLKTPVAQLAARRHGGVTDHLVSRSVDKEAPEPSLVPQSFAPGYVLSAVHRSLRRLRRDQIELLVLHEPPAAAITRADFLPALERLQRDGDINSFGICCATLDAAEAALEIPGVTALQVMANVLDTSIVDAIADRAADRGIGLIAIAVLGDGRMLAGVAPAERDLVLRGCLTEMMADTRLSSVLVGASNPTHVKSLIAAGSQPLKDDAERIRFHELLRSA